MGSVSEVNSANKTIVKKVDNEELLEAASKFIMLLLEHHLKLLSIPVPPYIQKNLKFYSKVKDCYFTENIKSAIEYLLTYESDRNPESCKDFLFHQLVNKYDDKEFLEFCALYGRMAAQDFKAHIVDSMYSFSKKSNLILQSNFENGLLSNFSWERLERVACDILKKASDFGSLSKSHCNPF